MKLKVGVLIPQSAFYSNMGMDFIKGFKLGIKGPHELEVVYEGIGYAAKREVLVDAAQKLLIQDIDLVVALLGHSELEHLFQLFEDNNKILLYSDLGATIPSGITHNKNVFGNSLSICESLSRGGKFELTRNHKKVSIAPSFYDSGYGASQSFLDQFLKEGEVTSYFITPMEPDAEEAQRMTEHYAQEQPDLILALHSGQEAVEFAKRLAHNQLQSHQKIIAGPMLVQQKILEKHGATLEGMESYACWSPTLFTKGNAAFTEGYDDEYEQEPSEFALLGYENGSIVKAALDQIDADRIKTKALRAALHAVRIEGPRGELSFNVLQRTSFTHYLRRVEQVSGKYTNIIVDELPEIPELIQNQVNCKEEKVVKQLGECLFVHLINEPIKVFGRHQSPNQL